MTVDLEPRKDNVLVSDILQTLSVMRARGFCFYRSFMSVLRFADSEASCGATMPVSNWILDPGGFVSTGALGTLADEALAFAIGRAAGEPVMAVTTGLMVNQLRETPARQIRAESEVVSLERRVGVARCKMTDEHGDLVAIATGTYAVRRSGLDEPYISSQGDVIDQLQLEPLTLQDLEGQEIEILKRMQQYLATNGQDGPLADFFGIEWYTRGNGESFGRWPLGPHLWNSLGVVHGGAMFGALTIAALACIPGDPPGHILEQYVQFVRPGQGDELHVEAHLLRRGQNVVFVHASVTDAHEKQIASALVTVRGAKRSCCASR